MHHYLPMILQSPVFIHRALLITSNLEFSKSFIFLIRISGTLDSVWCVNFTKSTLDSLCQVFKLETSIYAVAFFADEYDMRSEV